MSRTVKINPLLVLLAVLVGASLGSLIGGLFGGFVAALLAIPVAGALQVLVREAWQATAPRARGPAGAGVQDPSQAAVPSGAQPAATVVEPGGTVVASADTVVQLNVGLFPVPTDTREHGP
jgi:predicted lipid-binding transport protein (Tim44 family)